MTITSKMLDDIRKTGYRPQVVGAIYCDGKILMCYSEKYDLWMLPQGGVDNHENLQIAYLREMKEELGEDFINNCDKDSTKLLLQNKAQFQENKFNVRELCTDIGEQIKMIGKYYFVIIMKSTTQNIDEQKTEFDKCEWMDFKTAIEITKKIYQPSKKRIMLEIIEKMKKLDLVV
jgi:hypothetical protein